MKCSAQNMVHTKYILGDCSMKFDDYDDNERGCGKENGNKCADGGSGGAGGENTDVGGNNGDEDDDIGGGDNHMLGVLSSLRKDII